MTLQEAWHAVTRARTDLAVRGIPDPELAAAQAAIERAMAQPSLAEYEPYFIPNDIAMCTDVSVLNYSPIDWELDLPAGFSIEASAVSPHAFVKPYYIDPVNGIRRCKGLYALQTYGNRDHWDYDLAFIGQEGKHNDNLTFGLLADTTNLRFAFLEAFAKDYTPKSPARIRLQRNARFLANETPAERERKNQQSQYIRSIADSRFVLCPRGVGPHSNRFYEALACANIPIYIGDQVSKFPLDWIIDWSSACFRISCEEVADGSYSGRLDQILATTLAEVNRRRAYIFRIYWQFLAPERKDVFEHIVLLRVRELIREALHRGGPIGARASQPRLREGTAAGPGTHGPGGG